MTLIHSSESSHIAASTPAISASKRMTKPYLRQCNAYFRLNKVINKDFWREIRQLHSLLSDGFSSAFMHLHPLSVWRSHSRSHLSDTRREGRSAYFGREYGSATNCHTFFRFCHTLLPLANMHSHQAQ